MKDAILVLNAGSSSIKFSLFHGFDAPRPRVALKGQIEGIGVRPRFSAKDADGRALAERSWEGGGARDREDLLAYLLQWIAGKVEGDDLLAVGHRVVHGGVRHAEPTLVNAEVLEDFRSQTPFFPLHLPANLAPIETIARIDPHLPQAACFDSSFHRTIPDLAQRYGLPRSLHDDGLRGYGFHGLSYEYIAQAMVEVDPVAAEGKTVVAHLGSGASLCALVGGKSVACTLGFSGLDGLLMGTRAGRLDPAILLYLIQEKGMDARALEELLYRKSGLLGVSGISSDMRDLLASDAPHAREAVDLFVYRIVRELGSMAAAAGGMDALVFTAGIGEHAPPIRAAVCSALAWLGIRLDGEANNRNETLVSAPESAVPVYVIPTNEEIMIARHTRRLVSGPGPDTQP